MNEWLLRAQPYLLRNIMEEGEEGTGGMEGRGRRREVMKNADFQTCYGCLQSRTVTTCRVGLLTSVMRWGSTGSPPENLCMVNGWWRRETYLLWCCRWLRAHAPESKPSPEPLWETLNEFTASQNRSMRLTYDNRIGCMRRGRKDWGNMIQVLHIHTHTHTRIDTHF